MIRRLCTIKQSLLLLTGLAVLLWATGGWAQEASAPGARHQWFRRPRHRPYRLRRKSIPAIRPGC